MTRTLTLRVACAPTGCRNPTLRMADLLETYAQDLRDEASGGPFASAPGYATYMNGDRLEVINEFS